MGAAHSRPPLRVDPGAVGTGSLENCCGHVNTLVQPEEEWPERRALALEIINASKITSLVDQRPPSGEGYGGR